MSITPSIRKAAAVICLLVLTSLSAELAAQTRPTRTMPAPRRPARSVCVGNSFFYYNTAYATKTASWPAPRGLLAACTS
jgi:hypothetical protein